MSNELTRRDRKKLRAKQTISDIALKLFFEKGFANTTVAEIMAEADLGVGTFYNYFETKEEILKYCLSEKINSTHQRFENIQQADLKSSTKLSNLLFAIGKTYEENQRLLGMYMHYYRNNKHTHNHPPHMNEFQEILSSIIKEGQVREEFRSDIPLEIIAELFKGILKSAMTSKIGIPFPDNLKYKLSLFLEGVILSKKGDL